MSKYVTEFMGQGRKSRKNEGGEHRALVGGIVSDIVQRAALHPDIKDTTDLQEVDEERQLPKRRDRRFRVPLDVDTVPEGVHRNRVLGLQGLPFCLTRGVSPPGSSQLPRTGVGLSFDRLGGEVNCGF